MHSSDFIVYIFPGEKNKRMEINMENPDYREALDKYQAVKKEFESRYNPEKASHMEAYMRNRFPMYGFQAPERKAVYHELLKSEKKKRKIDWAFLNLCWADPHREFHYLVTDYLKFMQKYLSWADVPALRGYADTNQWWDTIDCFDRIIGNIGLSDPRIGPMMLEWAEDDNFWIRRLAIDHQLLRREKTDPDLLETIIVKNLGSSEFFINKAIGWSLRDYSKTDPDRVRSFIEKNRDCLAPLSIREASKYL